MQKKNESINEVIKRYQESTASAEASREFHRENPNFCEETIAYFKRMGELAERAATKEDLKNAMAALGKQEVEQRGHGRRITDLEDVTKKHAAELAEIRHQNINQSLEIRHINANTQDMPKRLNNIESMLTVLTESALRPAKPVQTLKPHWIKQLPAPAWIAFSVVTIAFLAAATGTMQDLFGWLSSVKIFGGN